VLDVSYDIENLMKASSYGGDIKLDHYGRSMPKPVHGSRSLGSHISSSIMIMDTVSEIYDSIVDRNLTVRRFNISVNNLLTLAQAEEKRKEPVQLSFFNENGDFTADNPVDYERENRIQQTLLSIRERYGKNSIVRCMNMVPGATEMERNRQIGGHRA
jgi:DNA polymerase V